MVAGGPPEDIDDDGIASAIKLVGIAGCIQCGRAIIKRIA